MAETIWNGPTVSFVNTAGSNPALPGNQDRITPDVWITRGSTQGIYNAEDESGFTRFSSPVDTRWADGATESGDPSRLSYSDWETWSKNLHGGPPNTVGVAAVMHIIPGDIYLDVKFTSWGKNGGGFSYLRATPAAVPEPATLALLGAGCAGLFVARSRWWR